MYSDELSDLMRTALRAQTKFRQFCDAKDATNKGLHRGSKFHWNRYSNVATQGRRLDESMPIPETNFTVDQATLTIVEAGNSVPYTGFLESLSKHALVDIIENTLKNDARKYFDIEGYTQFKASPLAVTPTSGTSTTSVTIATNGTPADTNNVALGADHIKAISDAMMERNIPAFRDTDSYIALSHPTTFRPLKNDLESISQYTETGIARIYAGEVGRYEGFRFVTQNHIPKGGADDSATFDPYTNTADAWNNAKSSWAFFFGQDTVAEGMVIPEEIRAKLPGDYGRSKGIAWYTLTGFQIVHDSSNATEARILVWDSAT